MEGGECVLCVCIQMDINRQIGIDKDIDIYYHKDICQVLIRVILSG